MKRPRSTYAAGGTPPEVKEYRAQLAAALKQRGVSLDVFLEANNETDYPVSRMTLFRHVKAIEADEPPLSPDKRSGRPAKMTAEQWHVVAGAILLEKKKTDLQWVESWIEANFDIKLGLSTVSRHLDEMELSFRLSNGRPMPKEMSEEKYAAQYYSTVLKLHNEGFWKHDPKKIVCVDCCTNSRRLEREKTISMRGAKPKKFAAARPAFTNTYVVAVCLEDEGQYPALMFTHDPAFDPDGPRAAEVNEWFKEFDISRDRVIFTPGKKKYDYESSDMIAHFKNVYRAELTGTRVIHDGGNSFKIDGEFILGDGADRLEVLPSATHGELSPLDNKLNAIAKNQWRTERGDGDFSKQDLYLLWCFDWLERDAIKSCWVQNFMLDVKKVTLEATMERLRGKTFSRGGLMEKYIVAYENWREEHGQEMEEEEFCALESTLDGSFWTK